MAPHRKGNKAGNCSPPFRRACARTWQQNQLVVIEHRKPLSQKVLEALFAFKRTRKTCSPCSYLLLEVATVGHCQRLQQLWPALAQCSDAHVTSCLLGVHVEQGSSSTRGVGISIFSCLCKIKRQGPGNSSASSRGFFCHHCWTIYAHSHPPSSPTHHWLVRRREERILWKEKFVRRGEESFISITLCAFAFWGSQKRRNIAFIIVKH